MAHLNLAHTKLESLAGLRGIQLINGDLIVWDNSQLKTLQGLGPVTQLFGKLWIDSNAMLKDMSGLEVSEGVSRYCGGCALLLRRVSESRFIGDGVPILNTMTAGAPLLSFHTCSKLHESWSRRVIIQCRMCRLHHVQRWLVMYVGSLNLIVVK